MQGPQKINENTRSFGSPISSSRSSTNSQPEAPALENNSLIIFGLPLLADGDYVKALAVESHLAKKDGKHLVTVFPEKNGSKSARVTFTSIAAAREFMTNWHTKKPTMSSKSLRVEFYEDRNTSGSNMPKSPKEQINECNSVLIKGLPENCNEDYLIAITKQKIKKGNKGKELVVIFPDHGSAKITFESDDEARKFIEEHHKKALHGYENKLTVEFYLEREGDSQKNSNTFLDTKTLSNPLVINKQSNQTRTIVRNVVYVQGLNKRIEKEELFRMIEITLDKAPATANIYHYPDGKSKGRGTISFKNAADAELCINHLNGWKANPTEAAWNMTLFKSTNIRRLPNARGNEHLFGERTEGYAYDCLACFETYDERDMVGCSPIETHFLCQDCIRRNCSAVVVDGQLGEHGTGLKCEELGCARVLLYAQVKRALLDRSTADQLDKRMTKDALRDIKGIEYCKEKNCNFGVIIDQDSSQMQFFVCQNPACLSQFCRICKISFAQHVGKTCDDVNPERKIALETRRNAVAEEAMTNSQNKEETCCLACPTPTPNISPRSFSELVLQDPTAWIDNDLMVLAGELDLSVEGINGSSIRDQVELWQKNASNVYPNFSSPKGKCLIINNHTFATKEPREGTEVDCKNVSNLFKQLGYSVIVHNDLTAKEMKSAFCEFAQDKTHGQSLVVIVLTHGEKKVFIGTDGERVNINYVLSQFNSKKARHLTGKPKIFLFQACRGSRRDKGVASDEIEYTDGSAVYSNELLSPFTDVMEHAKPQELLLPCESDFLIAYSTVSDYVSWRSTKHGSWFIQAICEVFSRHAKELDICDMMVLVNRRLAHRMYKQKQTSEFSSRLRKKFYFFPGVSQPA